MRRARTIVVGDIHGCYDELRDLLERASFGGDDRVVCVGDLIVKGEKNREVLELFASDARFSSVLGNHDRAVMRFWEENTAYYGSIAYRARLPAIALTAALGVLVFVFARSLFGATAAALAVALFAAEPTMLAHGRVVQTDVPAACGLLLL